MSFTDDNLDVLQNIEAAILSTYKDVGNFVDYSVMRTLEATIDYYVAKKIKRNPRDFNLSETEQLMSERIIAMCDWRLGETTLESDDGEELGTIGEPKTVQEIIDCLKRILKSVNFWNKRAGRQGYLDYIDKFL